MCVTNHLVFLCSEEALACTQLAIKDDAVSVLCFLLVFIRKKLYLSFEVFTASLKMAGFWNATPHFGRHWLTLQMSLVPVKSVKTHHSDD
jgi:hypothetical protein